VGSAGEDDETLGLQSRVRSRNALQPFTSRLFHHAGAANTPKPQNGSARVFSITDILCRYVGVYSCIDTCIGGGRCQQDRS